MFLRGVQRADAKGVVTFRTIYPGWYQGRAVHIHLKAHKGGNTVHTTQLFFDEDVSNTVYRASPYRSRSGNYTSNDDDSIYADGGADSTLGLRQDGTGYVGTLTMGIRNTVYAPLLRFGVKEAPYGCAVDAKTREDARCTHGTRVLGGNGPSVSVVGLGCNNFGMKIDGDAARAVVHAALDAGITHFDTAEMYGGGKSEEFLADALGARRDEVTIGTKFRAALAGTPRTSPGCCAAGSPRVARSASAGSAPTGSTSTTNTSPTPRRRWRRRSRR